MKKTSNSTKYENEIIHGEKLANLDTELIWGWGTPAGRKRVKCRAQLLVDGAQLHQESLALEIGCGTGLFTEQFARTGASLIAVDISADLLQKAFARNLPRQQVQFYQKRFEDCDIDGPFDAVIGSSVLHHLDVEISCRKIRDLLKPGGRMCFTEPNMLNPQIFLERRFRRWFSRVSPNETAFLRWKMKKMLERIGFEQVSIIPFDWLHPATPEKWIGFVGSIGQRLESIPLVKEFAGSLYICARKALS